ncbi:MAG: hypothetical protein IPL74_22455 [Bacteroidetes bacterium]|nr:hypothetical protein [Bacteroidota bacterium]
MKKNIFLITLILFCYNLFATIRIVPIQYASIQTALDSSSTGDTVLVQPGTYFENIYWPNVANIKLFSDGDSSNTVINGGGLKAVITLDGDIMSVTIDTNTVIKGFKITGGGCTVGFFCGVCICINAVLKLLKFPLQKIIPLSQLVQEL